jgi:uncharacterized protein
MPSPIEFLLAFLAALAAGAVNALAGGGTLITFPTLIALGIPPISANMTNTVALLPGYIGASHAQRKDLRGQEKRLWWFLPAGAIGGLLGGILLLNTGERLFSELVPFLILLASLLLAAQEPLRAFSLRRAEHREPSRYPPELRATIPIGLAGIYGGYFGAGLSVIILAVLGLTLDDNLTRLNALKQLISLSANVAAATFFIFTSLLKTGLIIWPLALVMMVGALLGGNLGGRLAGRIKPATLRWIVVSVGVTVSMIYFFR